MIRCNIPPPARAPPPLCTPSVTGWDEQEAAILEWELKGRGVTGGAVAGGLQELLRAADGSGGNAGVVDLMLMWVAPNSHTSYPDSRVPRYQHRSLVA